MTVRSLTTQDDGEDRVAPSWATFVNSFASQDWLLLGYLVAILVALAFGKGSNRSACIVRVSSGCRSSDGAALPPRSSIASPSWRRCSVPSSSFARSCPP
jgi:hypothetical protein